MIRMAQTNEPSGPEESDPVMANLLTTNRKEQADASR